MHLCPEKFIFLWGRQAQTGSIDRQAQNGHTAITSVILKETTPRYNIIQKQVLCPSIRSFDCQLPEEESSTMLPLPHLSFKTSLKHNPLVLQAKKQSHFLKQVCQWSDCYLVVYKPLPPLFQRFSHSWAMRGRSINFDTAAVGFPVWVICLNGFSDLQLILEIAFTSFPTPWVSWFI